MNLDTKISIGKVLYSEAAAVALGSLRAPLVYLMQTKTARELIESSNRFLIGLNIAALLVVLGLVGLNTRHVINYFNGPFVVDGAELESLTANNTPEKFFLTLSGSRLVDSGYRNVISTKNKYTGTTTETGSYPPRFSVNDLKGRLITRQEQRQLGWGLEWSVAGWRLGAGGAERVAV